MKEGLWNEMHFKIKLEISQDMDGISHSVKKKKTKKKKQKT